MQVSSKQVSFFKDALWQLQQQQKHRFSKPYSIAWCYNYEDTFCCIKDNMARNNCKKGKKQWNCTLDFTYDLNKKNSHHKLQKIMEYWSTVSVKEISDDLCGSGNYTAEMRLKMGRTVEPGDAVPARGNLRVIINLKTNNSQINLGVTSCCLSPTLQVDSNNSTCCLFSR